MDFKNLDNETKKIINMYTTARQFKNAISKDEKIIIKNGIYINKIYPYIVNKSFSCEIYLKIIILYNNDVYGRIHTLKDLYNKSKICDKFENYILENTKKNNIEYDKEKLDKDLDYISNAFVEWRYVFESEELYIPEGFLNIFCNYLDNFCVNKILENTGIDMRLYKFI